MGVPGLQGFLKANPGFWDWQDLSDTQVVIDASNLIMTLYNIRCSDRSHSPEDIYGGDMVAFGDQLRDIFLKLAKCNIKPILVSDGSKLVARGPADTERLFEVALDQTRQGFEATRLISERRPGAERARCACLGYVFAMIIDELKLNLVRVACEADSYAARIANKLSCPIVSDDSDFAIHSVDQGWILMNDIVHGQAKLSSPPEGYQLSCFVFKQSKLIGHYPGLARDLMPSIGALLGAPHGESPFDYLYPRGKLSKSQARISNFLKWLGLHDNFESAIGALGPEASLARQTIREALDDFRISERHDIGRELELIYPASEYFVEPDKQPARFIRELIINGAMPGTLVEIIFQKPSFGIALIDDLQLESAGQLRLRPLAVAIALLRPKAQASGRQTTKDNKATGAREVAWKCVIYDRAVGGTGELVANQLSAPDDLDGYGSLRSMHIGAMMQLDTSEKRRLLLATFRCTETVFAQIGKLVARFFSGSFQGEAQLCFMLIRYCALESKVKPMRAFIEAVLITLLNYSYQHEPARASDDIGKAQLASRAMVSVNEQGGPVPVGDGSGFRRTTHFISQLSVAVWSFGAIDSIVNRAMQIPHIGKYLDCPLIYSLTRKLSSEQLDIRKFLDVPELIKSVGYLATLCESS